MIEAILWDNDGVLVDTEWLYFEATRDAMGRLGVELTLERYREVSLREGRSCFDLVRDQGVADEEIGPVRDERNARYLERLRQGVELIEGVDETLSRLHGRLPMAIVTTTYAEHIDAIHGPHDTQRYFELIVTNGDYRRSKPHPDPYLLAAERLGLEPGRCLVVEDSERGLTAAARAGMRCLVVPNELTRHGDFSASHRVLESIRQVPEEVERLVG